MVKFCLERELVVYLHEIVYFVSCCETKWDEKQFYEYDFIDNLPRKFKTTLEMIFARRCELGKYKFFDESTKSAKEILYSLNYVLNNDVNETIEPYTSAIISFVRDNDKINKILKEVKNAIDNEYMTDEQYIDGLQRYCKASELAWINSGPTFSFGWED